jgi:hypothetical protein
MKRLFILLMVILCTFGCSKKETGRDAGKGEILLNPPSPESDPAISGAAKDFRKKSYKPLADYCWYDSREPKFMMLFSRPGDGSHASGARIGGLFAGYDVETKKWKIRAQSLAIAEAGAWGEAPQPRFIRLGPDRYGFIMEPGYTGQGYTEQMLLVYGVTSGGFSEMLKLPSFADNGGTGVGESEMYTVHVDLYQIVDTAKEFYDLKAGLFIDGPYPMTPDDEYGKVFGTARTARFVFGNGRYVVERKK